VERAAAAITMGVGTILDARRVMLMAFGEHKAPVVRRAVEGEMTTRWRRASSSSTAWRGWCSTRPRRRADAVQDPVAHRAPGRRRAVVGRPRAGPPAVIWLAGAVAKPILKLTDEDYNEHGLGELLAARGGAYEINIEVFKTLQKTINGWPGGKPGRPKFVPGVGVESDNGPDEFPKRILVFSPHPDDDVISMGGTLIRLCDQGHEVHVAYQTSGNIAVFDDEAERHADFVGEFTRELGSSGDDTQRIVAGIRSFIASKTPGQVDSRELQVVKTMIRRTEARAAAKYSGVSPERTHFLDLPFYETGKVRKRPLGEEDIRIVMEILERVRPHQVYAAGDLSDPHGTHRTCLAAVTTALTRLEDAPWRKACEVWLYRGAWQEWGPEQIEMAVPLAPSEVDRKRIAIFKHESQKDSALFPGPSDTREFWQRAEDRNRETAELYDRLGLPEYQALEGFVQWRPSEADGTLTPARPEAAAASR
jgi:glucosamine-6-phosphate deaminase